jgi:small nuclear ribonucleoprotein (snRNP)-like protein
VVGEVAVAAVVAEAQNGAVVAAARPPAATGRRKTSLTCPSTWRRRSRSSSAVAERVRSAVWCRLLGSFADDVWTVTGTLKGHDQLMNLVLDDVKETMKGWWMIKERLKGAMLIYDADAEGNTGTRNLGLIVARGTLLVLISPVDGSEEIPNPFLQADDEGQEWSLLW